MTTFILTWNPDRWTDPDYDSDVAKTQAGIPVPGSWSVGTRRTGINPGDRGLLLRQHRDRGMVAIGNFTSEIYSAEHWDGSGRPAFYAKILWEAFVDPSDRVPVEELKYRIPDVTWDRLRGSGVRVPDASATAIEEIWQAHYDGIPYRSPEEVQPGSTYIEGAVTRVEVNRYERDRRARAQCIRHHGTRCAACGFDFEAVYGELGRGFIHVHHVRDLSLLGPDYVLDAQKDLRPVCPNCHAMLHRERPAMSVKRLQKLVSRTTK